tara:strand:+ start:494 stop:679 length:186 start_codon:yes stop_codon:yes gene_type:complete
MIYVGYKFILDEDGLHLHDNQNRKNIKLSDLTKRHGWVDGDTFTLVENSDGNVLLLKNLKP